MPYSPSGPAMLTEAEEAELHALLEADEHWRLGNKLRFMYPDKGDYPRHAYSRHLEHFSAGREHRERLFLAANRVGKTTAGAYETALHLTGLYPAWWDGWRTPGAVRWWAAGKTNESTRDVVQAALFGAPITKAGRKAFDGTGMVPRDTLGAVTWKQGVADMADTVRVKHVSGDWSVLGLKTYQQGRGAFEGTAQHGIWVDEEPPMDVYAEALTRTMTTDGRVILTFTPLEGLSDVVLAFLEGTI